MQKMIKTEEHLSLNIILLFLTKKSEPTLPYPYNWEVRMVCFYSFSPKILKHLTVKMNG